MEQLIELAIDVGLVTMTLVLAAFGLAIIFGMVGVVNLGHGAMLTLGAYLTWQATAVGAPFFVAVLLAALGVGAIGAVFEFVIVRRFYDRLFDTLLITWGFYLIVTEAIKIVFGTDARSVRSPLPGALRVGDIAVPQYRLLLAFLSLALVVATAGLFYKTGFGVKARAMIQNREMATLLGVDARRMYSLVFVIGAALAGLAGGLLSPTTSIEPNTGTLYLIRSFFVVVVGGAGQILGGTLLGSFVIGGSETIFALFSEQIFAQTIVFALAVLILRFRPRGLLGGGGFRS